VGPASPAYDPRVIERFAEQLLAKADSVRVGSAVAGGVLGVLVGSIPLTPLDSIWRVPGRFGFATILLGALAGVLLGYVVGEGRAFRYRVQAQMALFQLDIERKVEAAVTAAAAPAPAPLAQAAPVVETASAPAAPPEPVQPPPPVPPLLRSADPEIQPAELPPLSPPAPAYPERAAL
jgi:hypothetical protein